MSPKRKFIYLGFFAAALVVFLIAYEVFSFAAIAGKREGGENLLFLSETTAYPSFAEISDPKSNTPAIGFAPDLNAINFGIVPSGGNFATKFIDVSNSGDSKVLFLLRAEGDIGNMIEFPQKKIVLNSGAKARMAIKLLTTDNTRIGRYGGTILLSKIKARNSFADMFLGLV